MVNYELPSGFIAKNPRYPRDSARLLILDRAAGKIAHRTFRDLPAFLQPGDCLVLNDTKVLPARLHGRKAQTGGKVELLLLEEKEGEVFRCLGKPGKGLRPGTRILLNGARHQLVGEVLSACRQERIIRFSGEARELFALGQIPLPPYIDRPVVPEDAQWYQTVYARHPGAVAAPTAGLHFTDELLQKIQALGIRIAFVTLHVGWGTFKPVSKEELESGRLHAERFHLPPETAQAIRETKTKGGRVVAVGTTVVRTLESWARVSKSEIASAPLVSLGVPRNDGVEGVTELFIRSPYEFKVVDALVTNFHLPGTSLLLLVVAFAGEEKIMNAYQEAIRERYRFYSYGDAMLIV